MVANLPKVGNHFQIAESKASGFEGSVNKKRSLKYNKFLLNGKA
jgi:hypothetical protein